jgi:hypothetical protein
LKVNYPDLLQIKDGAEIYKFDYLTRQEVLVDVYDIDKLMFILK